MKLVHCTYAVLLSFTINCFTCIHVCAFYLLINSKYNMPHPFPCMDYYIRWPNRKLCMSQDFVNIDILIAQYKPKAAELEEKILNHLLR